MPFLPTTKNELRNLGWDQPDIIIVSGDSYIDSPCMGTAVISRVLSDAGFRVGIIAQPDVISGKDITRLGSPRLFEKQQGQTYTLDNLVSRPSTPPERRRIKRTAGRGANLYF